MNYHFKTYLFLLAIVMALFSCSKKAIWKPIFNGMGLSNFETYSGNTEYKIENNMIVRINIAGLIINTSNKGL